MSEHELVDALHAVNGKLCCRGLSLTARARLDRHQDCLLEQLSLRHEDRADAEEQRRVDSYLEDCRRG